jgi:hypothetical protein
LTAGSLAVFFIGFLVFGRLKHGFYDYL